MHSLPQEFLALCRQLGDAQQRCSAAMAQQAAEIDTLRAEVVRLRGALVLRDTRLAMANEALAQAQFATPGLPRRQAMARHIRTLAERIATLSRECLRWRLAAQADDARAGAPAGQGPSPVHAVHNPQRSDHLDVSLAAADLVICQTGCISHDEYWRVQDHCRRTGKPCILVDQPLALMQPMVLTRMPRNQPAARGVVAGETALDLNKNGL